MQILVKFMNGNVIKPTLSIIEYSYIKEADKRAFYMAIDLWKKESGPARQGHKDFITMAVAMIPQLGLKADYRAYLALFDCWPDTRLLSWKTTIASDTFWQDKLSDHNLAKFILREMEKNNCHCNNEIYGRVILYFIVEIVRFWVVFQNCSNVWLQ